MALMPMQDNWKGYFQSTLFLGYQGNAREQSVRNFLREDGGYTYTNRDEIGYIQQVLRTLIVTKGLNQNK